jgi:hypothetical protein
VSKNADFRDTKGMPKRFYQIRGVILMKKSLFLLALTVSLALVGCASTTFYQPGAVTDNPIGDKVGEAPATDGIVAAAQNGGITKIATVDYRTTSSFFGVKQTVIVSGE